MSRTVFYGLKAFQTSWATTDMRSRKPGGGRSKELFSVCSNKCEQVRVPVSFVACLTNWASEASPTLGCSIEILRDIYVSVCLSYVKLTA